MLHTAVTPRHGTLSIFNTRPQGVCWCVDIHVYSAGYSDHQDTADVLHSLRWRRSQVDVDATETIRQDTRSRWESPVPAVLAIVDELVAQATSS